MVEKISTLEVRARIGDLLNRVSLRQDEFIIERKGKALAALVPIERLEQMRRAARQGLKDFFDQPSASGIASEEEAMAIALKAQREVRAKTRANAKASLTQRRRK